MSSNTPITVSVAINLPKAKVWELYTNPAHIIAWNAASPEWHCPKADNDLKIGGRFSFTMASKDGCHSFDFGGIYTALTILDNYSYKLDDDRMVSVAFSEEDGLTKIVVIFDPERMNPESMQHAGWQAILDNFKNYALTQ